MSLLKLLVVAIYVGCFVVVALMRRAEAIVAAANAGAQREATFWCRAPGFVRAFVLFVAAVLLGGAGRVGPLLALVFAVLTAPIAASGALRLLVITSRGLVFDGAFTAWDGLAGFASDAPTGRLTWWRREPGAAPVSLALTSAQAAAAAAALRPRLPEIRPA